jgi:hypothetical protein
VPPRSKGIRRLIALGLMAPASKPKGKRNERAEQPHQYRIKQVEKLLKLFEEARGRPARTVKDLSEWLATAEGKRGRAYDTDGKVTPEF